MHACLAVTCHLHFWQNDRDLLCATVVTQGGQMDTKIRLSTGSWPWRRKFPTTPVGTRTRDLSITSSRLQHSNHWAILASRVSHLQAADMQTHTHTHARHTTTRRDSKPKKPDHSMIMVTYTVPPRLHAGCCAAGRWWWAEAPGSPPKSHTGSGSGKTPASDPPAPPTGTGESGDTQTTGQVSDIHVQYCHQPCLGPQEAHGNILIVLLSSLSSNMDFFTFQRKAKPIFLPPPPQFTPTWSMRLIGY